MAMKKSIGRTLAHIDVAANTSVRIQEDFFNTHRDYHYLSLFEIDGAKRISQHLSVQEQIQRGIYVYSLVADWRVSERWNRNKEALRPDIR